MTRWLTAVALVAAAATAHARGASEPGEPVPFERSEFPEWAHALRRAEVTAIGAIPLALVLVRTTYDYTRFVARGFPAALRPWPFRPIGAEVQHTREENVGILVGAAALATAIALIDRAMLQRDAALPSPATADPTRTRTRTSAS